MKRPFKVGAATIGTLVLAFAIGCVDGQSATEPTEGHPAMPWFTESNSNCAVWSCSSGDCAQDPAIYGACCTTITDPGETGAPKPANCNAPPGGGGSPDWCNSANAHQACLQRKSEDTSFTDNCYSDVYMDQTNNGGWVIDENFEASEAFSACSG